MGEMRKSLYVETTILMEVRENKAKLLEKYGGIDGLLKHLEAERPRLEKEGWQFADIEKVRQSNYRRQIAESF